MTNGRAVRPRPASRNGKEGSRRCPERHFALLQTAPDITIPARTPPGDTAPLWRTVKDALREQLTSQSYETWIAPLELASFQNGTARVVAPTSFCIDWIQQHYLTHLVRAFAVRLGVAVEIAFEVAGEIEGRPPDARSMSLGSTPEAAPQPPDADFDLRYSFQSFVVGSSNQFAHAAARAVADSPGRQYNPLFVYGGVGLGKTHLMQAIGRAVRDANPSARVVYVSSERYMNELIASIQRGRTIEFKDKYRGVDLLLIDDIQFFETKERTQEEFFHTFNALYEARRQIVVTSDRPPRDITMLEERLVSRFQCGLVADIQPPDIETRVAILHAKAESDGQTLPDEVALFIANSAKSNIRELEGALTRLVALAALSQIPLRDVTVECAQEALATLVRPDRRRAGAEDIQHLVGKHYGVTVEQLRGKRRTSTLAEARQVAMYLCRQLTEMSLADIGARFGKRDHTTVLYACDKVRNQLSMNADLRRFVERSLEQLGDVQPA